MLVQPRFWTALTESSAMDFSTSAALIALAHIDAPVEQAASLFMCATGQQPVLRYFFINSSTTEVIAFTPVLSVGSGSGANKLECNDGRGLPDCLLAATRAGSTAPKLNSKLGIWWSRLYRPKSSLAMIGGICTTLSAPSAFCRVF